LNRAVIITGGSRGIGAETAKLFAANGFAVCINYISNDSAAKEVQSDILNSGGKCISVKADVSVEQDAARLFNIAEEQFGYISALVNNAGILRKQSRLENISGERFSKVLLTNVMSCFLCSKEAVKRMSTKNKGDGGTIVNVSSRASKSGSPNEYVDYASSKGAIDTFTRGLALEVASEGIRVNAVRPGLIHTEMHSSGGEPNRIERLKSKVPLLRGGYPSEVAEAIFWLSCNKSSFVTGSFIDPAGGL